MKLGSLFAGIGGFDLAARWAGIETVWQVEYDEFCQKVLAKHFPKAKRYGDINEINFKELEPVDIISGGFPCQPFSCAGKRKGKTDDRYLWPKMLEAIRTIRPAWVLGENVPGIINMELDSLLSDLENIGYTTITFDIPACALGLQNMERHVWVISTTNGKRQQGVVQDKVQGFLSKSRKLQGTDKGIFGGRDVSQTKFCRVGERVSGRMDGYQRYQIKSLGNAIVPQIAYLFFEVIRELEIKENIDEG
jgi:DNA (cytosine-5)-methyltransferase 1